MYKYIVLIFETLVRAASSACNIHSTPLSLVPRFTAGCEVVDDDDDGGGDGGGCGINSHCGTIACLTAGCCTLAFSVLLCLRC